MNETIRHCGCGKPLLSGQKRACSYRCNGLLAFDSRRHYSAETKAEIRQRWSVGESKWQISKAMGLSWDVINRQVRILDLPARVVVQVEARVLSAREAAGDEPLLALHPISWGAIAVPSQAELRAEAA